MKLKHALIATAVWTAVGLVACVALIAVIASRAGPGRAAEQRAQQAGGGAGMVMALGYAGIWLPYAFAVGRKKREAAASGTRRRRRDRDDDRDD